MHLKWGDDGLLHLLGHVVILDGLALNFATCRTLFWTSWSTMILIFKAVNFLDLFDNINNEFGIRPVAVIQDYVPKISPVDQAAEKIWLLNPEYFIQGHSRFLCVIPPLVLEKIAHPSFLYDFLLDI
jgi:hypothetical protein